MSEDEAIQTLRNHVCWVKSKNVKQAIEKVLDELETLQNGFNTAVEHQTELIRENSHLRYELFNNQKELEKKDKIINAMATTISGISEIRAIMGISNVIASQDEIIKRYERNVVDE